MAERAPARGHSPVCARHRAQVVWRVNLAEAVRRRALADRRPAENTVAAFRLQMRLRESWSDRVRLTVGLCTPQPNNWEGSPLPDALLWLLYPVKAAGIVGRKLALAFSKSSK